MSELNSDYWDCDCDANYIHRRRTDRDGICELCSACENESPDSHVIEVLGMLAGKLQCLWNALYEHYEGLLEYQVGEGDENILAIQAGVEDLADALGIDLPKIYTGDCEEMESSNE